MTNDLAYDPNNPEDYLMRLSARTNTSGKAPTETEYYNAMLAQKAMQAARGTPTDPFAEQLRIAQEEQARLRGEEKGRDETELEAYKKQLEAQYGQQRSELLESGNRQKTSAQNVYSFS